MAPMVKIRPGPTAAHMASRWAAGCGKSLLRPSIRAITTQRTIATNAAVEETAEASQSLLDRKAAIRNAKPFSEFLTDTFDRQHDYLRISITERCNLRCLYCMPEEGVPLSPPAHLLTTPEIFYLSSLFVSQGVTKIRLTGGEPTIRRDIIPLMQSIGSLRAKGLRELALTTNGISLHRKLDSMVEAGLTGVNLSLDTLDPFQFQIMTRRNGFEAVMKCIDRILDMKRLGADLKLKINCVVMRGLNERDIVPFVELGREKDIEVRFIEYMPFGGNKWSEGKMFSFQETLHVIRAKYPSLRQVPGHKNDTSKTFEVPGFVGKVGFITSMTNDFCGTCNRLRITSDGNLKVCLHGNAEVSLRDLLREDNGGEPIDQEAFERIKQIELDRRNGHLSDETIFGWGPREKKLLNVIGQAVKRKAEKHADLDNLANMENRPMILIDRSVLDYPLHPLRPASRNRQHLPTPTINSWAATSSQRLPFLYPSFQPHLPSFVRPFSTSSTRPERARPDRAKVAETMKQKKVLQKGQNNADFKLKVAQRNAHHRLLKMIGVDSSEHDLAFGANKWKPLSDARQIWASSPEAQWPESKTNASGANSTSDSTSAFGNVPRKALEALHKTIAQLEDRLKMEDKYPIWTTPGEWEAFRESDTGDVRQSRGALRSMWRRRLNAIKNLDRQRRKLKVTQPNIEEAAKEAIMERNKLAFEVDHKIEVAEIRVMLAQLKVRNDELLSNGLPGNRKSAALRAGLQTYLKELVELRRKKQTNNPEDEAGALGRMTAATLVKEEKQERWESRGGPVEDDDIEALNSLRSVTGNETINAGRIKEPAMVERKWLSPLKAKRVSAQESVSQSSSSNTVPTRRTSGEVRLSFRSAQEPLSEPEERSYNRFSMRKAEPEEPAYNRFSMRKTEPVVSSIDPAIEALRKKRDERLKRLEVLRQQVRSGSSGQAQIEAQAEVYQIKPSRDRTEEILTALEMRHQDLEMESLRSAQPAEIRQESARPTPLPNSIPPPRPSGPTPQPEAKPSQTTPPEDQPKPRRHKDLPLLSVRLDKAMEPSSSLPPFNPPIEPIQKEDLRSTLLTSGIQVIDPNLTIDFDSSIAELQSQLYTLHSRLQTAYPKIETLPYEVWKSRNGNVLRTWLKILARKWKTRFGGEKEGESEEEEQDDVRLVLQDMVKRHELSREAAERMALRFQAAFERREGLGKDGKVDLNWDEFGVEMGWLKDEGGQVAEASGEVVGDVKHPHLKSFMSDEKGKDGQFPGDLPFSWESKPSSGFRRAGSARRFSTSSRALSTSVSRLDTSKPSSPSSTTTMTSAEGSNSIPTALPHLTASGSAHMVSVSAKQHTIRTAVAVGRVQFSNSTPLDLIRANAIKKGDVLSVSRIAGIMAAKQCPTLIPLCHPITLTHVGVALSLFDGAGTEKENIEGEDKAEERFGGVQIQAKVECTGATGVEMEALTAVMGAGLTVVDMCKAVDKGMRVEGVRVTLKEGGRSGTWREEGWVEMVE